ncbi:hypothetical protein DFH28DRAFT_1089449 [Melampsora americana]|nr:hypothetical protein DFH28DRAFT_1089449 [Melampsora americana]
MGPRWAANSRGLSQASTLRPPSLFNKIYGWLAKIFTLEPFLSLPSMQTRQPHYRIVAINPYQPLPYPPKSKSSKSPKETAIVCPSNNCKTRTTHSTVYFHSNKELDSINANIKRVPSGMDLQQILNAPPTPPATQAQAINIRNDTAPQPPATQDTGGGTCAGIEGRTAPRHNPRKNAECTANACKACCLMWNTKIPCSKHNAMSATDQRKQQQSLNANGIQQTAQSGDNNPIERPIKQGARSMGRHVYKNRIKTDYLDQFRTLQLQEQAEERLRTVNAEKARRSIALVVWGASKDDPLGFWGGMVNVISWPEFSLSQSNEIKAMVMQAFGPDWQGGLQVWSEDHQLWLHTPMDVLVSYPVNTRKLLIVFPPVDPSKCRDVVSQLASVSTGGEKERMNLTAFIQRHNSETPQKQKGKERIISLSPSPPDILCLSPLATKQTGTSTVTLPKRPRSISPVVLSETETNGPVATTVTAWPGKTVTMFEMKIFFDLTIDPFNKTNKEAFQQVFGSRYEYVHSTVSTYQRWLKSVTSPKVDAYVAIHGDKFVKHGRKHFIAEWKAADNRPSRPSKRISPTMPSQTRSSSKMKTPAPSTPVSEERNRLLTDPTHTSPTEEGSEVFFARAVGGVFSGEDEEDGRPWVTDPDSPSVTDIESPSVTTPTTLPTSSLDINKLIPS